PLIFCVTSWTLNVLAVLFNPLLTQKENADSTPYSVLLITKSGCSNPALLHSRYKIAYYTSRAKSDLFHRIIQWKVFNISVAFDLITR
ncbi:hypothetical protein V7P28_18710, partial [Klebsiella michiganensis]